MIHLVKDENPLLYCSTICEGFYFSNYIK